MIKSVHPKSPENSSHYPANSGIGGKEVGSITPRLPAPQVNFLCPFIAFVQVLQSIAQQRSTSTDSMTPVGAGRIGATAKRGEPDWGRINYSRLAITGQVAKILTQRQFDLFARDSAGRWRLPPDSARVSL